MPQRCAPVLGVSEHGHVGGGRSSTERMRPSASAIPISIAVTVLAIDHEVKRCRSCRAY